jgi:hypothetical protein
VWIGALTVAVAAGVATAHGLYQVAAGAGVPAGVAWLYPLITDGLAIVAYAATARLHDGGRRYAASIVILAAGLSGLAQAVFLAGGLHRAGPAPTGLLFGVGAWPAVAAALTAHLLHLISSGPTNEQTAVQPASNPAFNPASLNTTPYNPAFSPPSIPAPSTEPSNPVQVARPAPTAHSDGATTSTVNTRSSGPGQTASDRARAAADRYRDEHGALPTVSELVRLSGTSRGTAAKALNALRTDRWPLHIVNANPDDRTSP